MVGISTLLNFCAGGALDSGGRLRDGEQYRYRTAGY